LPREVGEIFVYYLWFVVPFVRDMWMMVEKKARKAGFVWEATPDGRRWTSMRFRHAIKREALSWMGVALTIAQYRQCAVAMADKYIAGLWHAEQQKVNEDWDETNHPHEASSRSMDVLARQAGHQTTIRGWVYGRGANEGEFDSQTAIWDFEAASSAWARFLRIRSTLSKRPREDEPALMSAKRWKVAKGKDQSRY